MRLLAPLAVAAALLTTAAAACADTCSCTAQVTAPVDGTRFKAGDTVPISSHHEFTFDCGGQQTVTVHIEYQNGYKQNGTPLGASSVRFTGYDQIPLSEPTKWTWVQDLPWSSVVPASSTCYTAFAWSLAYLSTAGTTTNNASPEPRFWVDPASQPPGGGGGT